MQFPHFHIIQNVCIVTVFIRESWSTHPLFVVYNSLIGVSENHTYINIVIGIPYRLYILGH